MRPQHTTRGITHTLTKSWRSVVSLLKETFQSKQARKNVSAQSPLRTKTTTPLLVSGFTLIEIVIVISILGILMALLITPFVLLNRDQALSGSTLLVKSALSEARSKTVSSEGDTTYGIHFVEGDAAMVLFAGSSYDPSDADNVPVSLHQKILIHDIDVAGGGSDIIFHRILGSTDESGTVVLRTLGSEVQYATVTVFATGVVE